MDQRKTTGIRAWSTPGVIVAVAASLTLSGDWGRALLRYDRVAIMDGDWWRLISGHLVHLGWSHFALNAIGVMLVFYLVAARFSAIGWLQVAVASIVAIDLGFWFLEPQLEWYVGLSGLLHGLLAAGVVQGIRAGQIDFWVLGGLLLLKLVYEALFGPLPGSEASSGGSVVVAAHLYGAAGGALSGLYLSFRKDRQPPI